MHTIQPSMNGPPPDILQSLGDTLEFDFEIPQENNRSSSDQDQQNEELTRRRSSNQGPQIEKMTKRKSSNQRPQNEEMTRRRSSNQTPYREQITKRRSSNQGQQNGISSSSRWRKTANKSL